MENPHFRLYMPDGRRNNGGHNKEDPDWDPTVKPEDLEDMSIDEIERYAGGLKNAQGSRGKTNKGSESQYPDQATNNRGKFK
jgi:hypothetical protein